MHCIERAPSTAPKPSITCTKTAQESTLNLMRIAANLNISRYVSTAKQEVAIDLSATHEELLEIEK
jgi:hypothetical protein